MLPENERRIHKLQVRLNEREFQIVAEVARRQKVEPGTIVNDMVREMTERENKKKK